jgi:iron complex transport system permease protein
MQRHGIRIVLIFVLIISILIAAGTGAMSITPLQVIAILLGKVGIHLPVSFTVGMAEVLLQIRLPRVCLGVLVGAGLAIAGAAIQGLFRNPMADPILIGISSGASLFAVMSIVLLSSLPIMAGSRIGGHYLLNFAAFAGACLSSLLVFRLSGGAGRTGIAALLLAGLAVNALCNALTGLITYTANNEELRSVTFWLMGSLGGASWKVILSLLPFILVPLWGLPRAAKSLNAYALGEADATYLGIDVRRLKIAVILLSTLAVGASVAVSGIIGFVGLIVPHILRVLSGGDHRSLLVNSALFGSSLLTLADVCSRTLIAPAELPIGIITAVIGTPLFMLLLSRQKKIISI